MHEPWPATALAQDQSFHKPGNKQEQMNIALLACCDCSLSLLPLLSGPMFLAECPRAWDSTAPLVTWSLWIWLCMVPPGEMGSCIGHLTVEADSHLGHLTASSESGMLWLCSLSTWHMAFICGSWCWCKSSFPSVGKGEGTGLKPHGWDFFNGSHLQKSGGSKEEGEWGIPLSPHLCPWRGQEGKGWGPGQEGDSTHSGSPCQHTHMHTLHP